MALLLSEESIQLLRILECPIANRLAMLNTGMAIRFTVREVQDTYSTLKGAIEEGLFPKPDLMTAESLILIFEKEFPWCCEKERGSGDGFDKRRQV